MYSNQNMKQTRLSKSLVSSSGEGVKKVSEEQSRYAKGQKKEVSKPKGKSASGVNKMNL